MRAHIAILCLLFCLPAHAAAGPLLVTEAREAKLRAPAKPSPLRSELRSAFAAENDLFLRLRKNRAVPLWQLINSREKELFIGVDRNGTVGFHYSF